MRIDPIRALIAMLFGRCALRLCNCGRQQPLFNAAEIAQWTGRWVRRWSDCIKRVKLARRHYATA